MEKVINITFSFLHSPDYKRFYTLFKNLHLQILCLLLNNNSHSLASATTTKFPNSFLCFPQQIEQISLDSKFLKVLSKNTPLKPTVFYVNFVTSTDNFYINFVSSTDIIFIIKTSHPCNKGKAICYLNTKNSGNYPDG